jgi:hypothetical protein
VWGIVPESGLAAFDGQGWSAPESWAFYAPPEASTLRGSRLALAPDGALWMLLEHGIARFDPSLAGTEGGSADAAWATYRLEDGMGGGYSPIAFGPGGEVWVGATRFEPGVESR